MENASKALIMAASVLMAILLISLLIYAWGLYTDYQNSKDSLADIENTAKFNAQFSDYDRDDVLGYELLSLLNKIVDYNERRTIDTENGNADKYPPIKIKIKLGDEGIRKKLTYNNEILLFKSEEYVDDALTAYNEASKKRASFKNDIIDAKIEQLKENLKINDETALTGMAKNISAIFKTKQQQEGSAGVNSGDYNYNEKMNYVKRRMVTTFNSYSKQHQLGWEDKFYDMLTLEETGGKLTPKTQTMKDINGVELGDVYTAICSYYEYMQFKRGIFKCTEVEYDKDNTGRLISIAFEFTEKIR